MEAQLLDLNLNQDQMLLQEVSDWQGGKTPGHPEMNVPFYELIDKIDLSLLKTKKMGGLSSEKITELVNEIARSMWILNEYVNGENGLVAAYELFLQTSQNLEDATNIINLVGNYIDFLMNKEGYKPIQTLIENSQYLTPEGQEWFDEIMEKIHTILDKSKSIFMSEGFNENASDFVTAYILNRCKSSHS